MFDHTTETTGSSAQVKTEQNIKNCEHFVTHIDIKITGKLCETIKKRYCHSMDMLNLKD